MTVTVKRKNLHQMIDGLSEQQLSEVTKFVELLVAQRQPDLIERKAGTGSGGYTEDLDEIVQTIKRTPPNSQIISLPTMKWADVAAQIPQLESEDTFDVEAWNEQWDAIETEMEASRLAHEAEEHQEQ